MPQQAWTVPAEPEPLHSFALAALFDDDGRPRNPVFTPTPWIMLPAEEPRKQSCVRMLEVPHGRGLMFMPWGNYNGFLHNGPEYTLEFFHSGGAGCHHFTLEPADVVIVCPQQYPWPICVRCKRFLFPAEDHRRSRTHKAWRCRLDRDEFSTPAILSKFKQEYGPSIVASHNARLAAASAARQH